MEAPVDVLVEQLGEADWRGAVCTAERCSPRETVSEWRQVEGLASPVALL